VPYLRDDKRKTPADYADDRRYSLPSICKNLPYLQDEKEKFLPQIMQISADIRCLPSEKIHVICGLEKRKFSSEDHSDDRRSWLPFICLNPRDQWADKKFLRRSFRWPMNVYLS
jgi:hypothetical protein